jgi:hypothetical protein
MSFIYLGTMTKKKGNGGQAAEMRGESNAVGIRTKRAPSTDSESYWSDRNFDQNCSRIEDDLARVRSHLRRGGIVIIPTDGLGTGHAQMERRCPRTFYVLQQSLASLDAVPVTVAP